MSMRQEIIKSIFGNLNKIIEVDDYTTTIGSHINKTFATIISSDKELSNEYENYLTKKEETKTSKADKNADGNKMEQKYKPKTEDYYKEQKAKTFERTF